MHNPWSPNYTYEYRKVAEIYWYNEPSDNINEVKEGMSQQVIEVVVG